MMATDPAADYRTPVHRPAPTPVAAAAVGGVTALAIGLWWMRAGGAPGHYLLVNAAAGMIGAVLALALARLPRTMHGPMALAAAAALLATGVSGVEMEGIRRWVSVAGAVQMQPAFVLLPLLLCSYARRPSDPWHGGAVMIAALAVAVQPDRSMAAMLCVAVTAVGTMVRTARSAALAMAAAVALAATLWRSDPLSGVRFVEHVIVDGWRISIFAGVLLTAGAAALLAPLVLLSRTTGAQRRAVIAFGCCWSTLLVASLIAPYPTPLLGYGASAIIGYALSIIALHTTDDTAKDIA